MSRKYANMTTMFDCECRKKYRIQIVVLYLPLNVDQTAFAVTFVTSLTKIQYSIIISSNMCRLLHIFWHEIKPFVKRGRGNSLMPEKKLWVISNTHFPIWEVFRFPHKR